MSACPSRSRRSNASAEAGTAPRRSASATIRYVPRISCASRGRASGTTPRNTISSASSTVNSVPSMKLEKSGARRTRTCCRSWFTQPPDVTRAGSRAGRREGSVEPLEARLVVRRTARPSRGTWRLQLCVPGAQQCTDELVEHRQLRSRTQRGCEASGLVAGSRSRRRGSRACASSHPSSSSRVSVRRTPVRVRDGRRLSSVARAGELMKRSSPIQGTSPTNGPGPARARRRRPGNVTFRWRSATRNRDPSSAGRNVVAVRSATTAPREVARGDPPRVVTKPQRRWAVPGSSCRARARWPVRDRAEPRSATLSARRRCREEDLVDFGEIERRGLSAFHRQESVNNRRFSRRSR